MAGGFRVTQTIGHPPERVWARLVDFARAGEWMTGVADMAPVDSGALQVGTRLRFTSRGAERETQMTALDPGRRLALTSTQAGVTATYTYSLAPAGRGTEVTLDAVCEAAGLWKLIHPLIVLAMKRSDASHLKKLETAIDRQG